MRRDYRFTPRNMPDTFSYSIASFRRSSDSPQNFFIFAAALASGSFMCWATTWHLFESFGRNEAETLVLPSSQVMRSVLLVVALRMAISDDNHFFRAFSSVQALKALPMGASIVRLTLIS